jgi:hypothetical protein
LTSRTPARARVFDDLTERGVLCDGDVALSLIWVAAAGTGRPLMARSHRTNTTVIRVCPDAMAFSTLGATGASPGPGLHETGLRPLLVGEPDILRRAVPLVRGRRVRQDACAVGCGDRPQLTKARSSASPSAKTTWAGVGDTPTAGLDANGLVQMGQIEPWHTDSESSTRDRRRRAEWGRRGA